MTTKSTVPAHAPSRMAVFLSRTIDDLKGEATVQEIAHRIGYRHGNMISMFRSGEAKVPLDKIPALAETLDVDVGHLMRLGLDQYWPDKMAVITEVFGRVVTANEMILLKEIRERTSNRDPKPTLRDLRHSHEFAI